MWHRRTGAQKAKDVAHLATYYWSRLIATAGCWFFWDFGFYGNKVFQSQFVSILTGGSASANPPTLCLVTLGPPQPPACLLRNLLRYSLSCGCADHRICMRHPLHRHIRTRALPSICCPSCEFRNMGGIHV